MFCTTTFNKNKAKVSEQMFSPKITKNIANHLQQKKFDCVEVIMSLLTINNASRNNIQQKQSKSQCLD